MEKGKNLILLCNQCLVENLEYDQYSQKQIKRVLSMVSGDIIKYKETQTIIRKL